MNIEVFDFTVNLLQAILWQYDESPNLISLLSQKQAWYDLNQTAFWESWYTNIFDLRTANAFGLAVWSYILNLPLFIPLNPDPMDKPLWGFNAYDPTFPTLENTYVNFGNGNFSTQNQIITLTVEEQRFILRLRYFQLVSNGTVFTNENNLKIDGINKFLNYLISTSLFTPIGSIYALDGLDMSMTYVFNFDVPYSLRYVLETYDLLPRPAAVGIKYTVLTGSIWGFGMYNENFGHGNFVTPFL